MTLDYDNIVRHKCYVLDGREVSTEASADCKSHALLVELEDKIFLDIIDYRYDNSGTIGIDAWEEGEKLAKYILHGFKRTPKEELRSRIEKPYNPLEYVDRLIPIDERSTIGIWEEGGLYGFAVYSRSDITFCENEEALREALE